VVFVLVAEDVRTPKRERPRAVRDPLEVEGGDGLRGRNVLEEWSVAEVLERKPVDAALIE